MSALKFITLCDSTGRNTSLALNGRPHYSTPGMVRVVGGLPHGLQFRPATEADRKALIAWLESEELRSLIDTGVPCE